MGLDFHLGPVLLLAKGSTTQAPLLTRGASFYLDFYSLMTHNSDCEDEER